MTIRSLKDATKCILPNGKLVQVRAFIRDDVLVRDVLPDGNVGRDIYLVKGTTEVTLP